MNDRSNQDRDDEAFDGEIIEPVGTGHVAVLHRVELDQQIATAKQYPRNLPAIKQELSAMVTMDEETAEECIYALPRGNKTIKGPSARFADALISFWGNARSGAYVVQVDKEDKFIEAVGFFQDVERNVIRQRRVRRPIATAKGYLYNADMINMTGNAACVIAERNAILNGIPKPLWGPAYDRAFALVAGTTQTLGDKIARAKKQFLAMEVSFDLVLQKIGRADESKLIPEDVVTLRGMLTALKSGEETTETIFGRGVGVGSDHEQVKNPLKADGTDGDQQQRGDVGKAAKAVLVISEDGDVVKQKDDGDYQQGDTVLDKRFHPDDQFFDRFDEWEASLEPAKLSNPLTRPKPKPEGGTRRVAAEARQEAQESRSGDGGAKPRSDENSEPSPRKNETAAPSGSKAAYDPSAEGYFSYMKGALEAAKTKTAVNDLWSSTRADRRELLGDAELSALEDVRQAALDRIAGSKAV